MSDLLDPVEGLQLSERPVRSDEVGTRISTLAESGELVLAIHRNGEMLRFDHADAAVIRAGDSLVFARTV
jgi:voltage-gated potassium channel